MRIGKLAVTKAQSEALGEYIIIKCENIQGKEFYTVDGVGPDAALSLKVSKATALKLAKWIKENVK